MIKVVQVGLFCLFVFVMGILLLLGDPLYEAGSYYSYATSFLQDGDLNIVNQMAPETTRIVTANFYHVDGHTVIQTPFLVILNVLLKPLFKPVGAEVPFLIPYIIGLTFSLFSLLVSHVYLQKIAKELKIPYRVSDFFLFLFGCSAIYFSFFVVTVVEVYLLPFLCFSLYLYLKNKRETLGWRDLLSLSLSLGLLLCSTSTYIPYALAILLFLLFDKKIDRKKKMVILIFFVMYPSLHYWNILIKYGRYIDLNMGAVHLLEFSVGHFFDKLLKGYLLKDFFRSPLIFLTLIFLLFKGIKTFKKDSSLIKLEKSIVVFWCTVSIFAYMPFLGDLVEGHLSGRYFLRIAPVLILGISYFRSQAKSAFLTIGLYLLSFFGFLCVLNFLALDIYDPIEYATRTFASVSEWLYVLKLYQQRMIFNSAFVLSYVWGLLFLSIALGFIYRIILFRTVIWSSIIGAVLLFFGVITVMNSHYGPRNVQAMQQQGFYEHKVVGNGAEIFIIDYVLEKAANIERSNPQLNLDNRIESLYQEIEKQVVKRTPEFDEAIRRRDKSWSFFLNE